MTVAFACALAAVVLILLPAATLAAPAAQDLESLQAQARQARAEVARLDHASQITVEKYNVARAELDDINVWLVETRRDLARAQLQLDVARAVLGERMADIYKNGGVSVLDVMLGTRDFTEIDTQIDYFRQISQADEDTVAGIEALTQRVGQLADRAEKDRAQALTREMDLREKRADVEDQLAQRQALLAELDARVKEIIARQARLDAAASQRLADAVGVDIDSINGSAAQIALVKETMKYLGIPYVWGGASPSGGFDCSGLVMYVYAKFGVSVLHGATLQARQGTPVPLSRMQPADLVFFGDASFYSHVGIYIGSGLFIEAPHTGDVVKVSKLDGRGCALACRYPIRLP
ncbi:MAG: NlpC/P60 family protein [Actinobacteria bacterium]|nr:NlpC/P60 family protein [Actinomycetota bacterium]